MRKTSLNQGWEFMRGEPSNFPGMQRETKVVDLPHDFMGPWTRMRGVVAKSAFTTAAWGLTRRCLS